MQDWFYAPGSAIVSAASGTTKSRVVVAIRSGYKTLPALEQKLGIRFSPGEEEDVRYLLRLYSPMSYDQLGGCSGCGGCGGE